MNNKKKVLRNANVYILYAAVLILFIVPIYWVIVTSFKQANEMFSYPPKWFALNPTIEHYKLVIMDSKMPLGFRNSMIISLSAVLITGLLSSLAAFGFSRFEAKSKKALLLFLITMKMLPTSVLIIPLYVMMNNFKMLDTFQGIISVYVAMNIPFSVWILKSFYDSIPRELDDAAKIDGCNTWAIFLKIIVPLTIPGLIATSVITFFTCWNEFIISMILTSSTNIQPMSIGLYSFMTEQGVKWGPITAATSIAIIIPGVIFVFLQKYFISGITEGGIKG